MHQTMEKQAAKRSLLQTTCKLKQCQKNFLIWAIYMQMKLCKKKIKIDFTKGTVRRFLTFCNSLLTCMSGPIYCKAIHFSNMHYLSWWLKLKIIVASRQDIFSHTKLTEQNKDYKNNSPHHHLECSLKSKLSLLCFTFSLQSGKKTWSESGQEYLTQDFPQWRSNF